MIAPVQAFILKQLLLEGDVVTWKAIEAKKCDQLLVKAMVEIINQAADTWDSKYLVVYTNHTNVLTSNKEASDPKSTVNSVEDTNESNRTNKTQVTEQTTLLDSEVFHSQLRYVSNVSLQLI